MSPDRRRSDPPKAVINIIAEGFAGEGITYSSRKRHLKSLRSVNTIEIKLKRSMPTMYVTDKDFRGIDPEHDDPMVIKIEVANFVVMKTLFDQGTYVDILYMKTFRKMGLS